MALMPPAARISADTGAGSIILTTPGSPSTENFDTLANSGTTNSTLPTGWYLTEQGGGARDNEQYAADNGLSNTGDTYSYGSASATDRAFGALRSGSLIPLYGAKFTNNTASTINSLEVSYIGEQWRLGTAGRTDRIDFQYSLNATDLMTGTYTDVDALDFTTPNIVTTGAKDGNAAGNRTNISFTISGLSIANGATFFIRWADFDASGADDGLSVDDFSITPNPVGPPSLSINNTTVTEGDSGTVAATFTVTLSSGSHSGVTFDIATQDNSATTVDNDYVAKALVNQSIPGGSTTYNFDVIVNGDTAFESNETFFVNVTNVTGATVTDGQGIGTITNDDCPAVAGDIVISQVYGGGGNAGAMFTHDFIELFNQGPAAVNLSGWSVQYASASGTSWQVTSLSGSIAPGGYYLVQEAAGGGGATPLPTPDAVGTIAMAAGAGKVALSDSTTAFSGACPTCPVDLVGYGSANCFEGAGPAGALSNTTATLRKRGGCFDSNNNIIDFSVGSPNPRNTSTPTRSCDFIALAIHDIQGAGLMTPFLGQDVSTMGIVTGRKTNGFFIQTPDASVDADPTTSEGIFVFTSSAPAVAVGDSVTVRGTAGEFFNLTQIESSLPGDVTVDSSGNALPASITLTTTILDPAGMTTQLERFEGMRLHADSLVSVAPTNEFGETFTVIEGVTRPLREPGIEISRPVPPDPTSGVPDCCIPRWDENPERIMIDSDGLAGSSPIPVTSNVTFSGVTGPLDFTFGDYKILPETPPAITDNISAVPVPAPATCELTVAGFNIENFNNNATQRLKAALAIRDVLRLPDIIGTIEIFELSGLQALANEIEIISGVHYEARLIEADGLGGDADQDVGFLVKTSRVQIDSVTQVELAGCDGTAANCNTFIDPNTGQPALLNDRPPLVLRATVLPSLPIIVVVNHLRSFIDIEALTGEGPRVRAKRKAQAEFLANLLQDLQTNNPTTPIMSIGDYNAYQFNDGFTDPVATIKGSPTPDDQVVVDESPDLVDPNFINLTDGLPSDQRYSFVFEGTPQAIDHFIINSVANASLQRYVVARNNSDFPQGPTFANDATRPERCSDHDMPVAYFRFPVTISDVSVDRPVLGPPNHKLVNVTVDYEVISACSVTCTLSVSSNEPVDGTGDGDTSPDWIVFDAHHVQLRAERAGKGNDRVYTITITCTDDAGNSSSQTVTVTVPHDEK